MFNNDEKVGYFWCCILYCLVKFVDINEYVFNEYIINYVFEFLGIVWYKVND